jgi:nitrogen fixation-related uncharacterized protein
MATSWDSVIALLAIAGFLFFALAVLALYWAAKNGQFEHMEAGSKVIFDEEEPEGRVLDAFPERRKSIKKKSLLSASLKTGR